MYQTLDVTAIAVLSNAVTIDPRNALRGSYAKHQTRSLGAIASFSSRGDADALEFRMATLIPRSSTALQAWVDREIADDPLLVGYRLRRISRLLRTSGFSQNLALSFSEHGRHEVLDVVQGQPTRLAVTALLNDVMAIDEDALVHRHGRCLDAHNLATLALVNAAASWIVWFRRAYPGRAHGLLRERVLTRLGRDLERSGAPDVVTAAIRCTIQ